MCSNCSLCLKARLFTVKHVFKQIYAGSLALSDTVWLVNMANILYVVNAFPGDCSSQIIEKS